VKEQTLITVISYGTGHGPLEVKPDVIFSLAHRFRDPHVSPEMREMTGLDKTVVDNIMAQPGAHAFLLAAFNLAAALYAAHDHADILVAFSCVGGRHRSVAFAVALHALLARWFPGQVELVHRDVEKAVIRR
jgi:RNase adaptor protein for sRNA GlmZ degradation